MGLVSSVIDHLSVEIYSRHDPFSLGLLCFLFLCIVYYSLTTKSRRSIVDAFRFIFPAEIYRWSKIKPDVKLALVNIYIEKVALKFIFSATAVAYWNLQFLQSLFPESPQGEPWTPISLVLFSLFSFLFTELVRWVTHWLFHKVDFLWELHKVHHSATNMNVLVLFRENFLYYFIKPLLRYPIIGVVQSTVVFIFNKEYAFLTILGFNVFSGFFNLFLGHFKHSHLPIDFGPTFGKIFTSPRYHHLHHSSAEEHRDVNFAFNLSFLDWILGTQVLPEKNQTLHCGLSDNDDVDNKTLYSLMVLPLLSFSNKIWARVGVRRNS